MIDCAWVAKAMPAPAITYTGNWINDLGEDEAVIISGNLCVRHDGLMI